VYQITPHTFNADLEKTPLVVPEQFNTHVESENTKLLPEAELMLERVMHRLADRVRIRRIQIFPLFEDYDKVHNGTVSRGQFHRVLSELDLGGLASRREFAVLYQKFDVIIGLKHDFNYISFCDMINDYANFEFGMP
jgi:Ca2+-binding EF-hand superfamily protein